MQDHCTNCEVMLVRLQTMGYTAGITILKDFVQPLRPAAAGHAPVQRYETKPGEQVQFDWGEFVYEQEGQMRKFYGFYRDPEVFAHALCNLCETVRHADAHPLLDGGV
jgi:hypothetical protein